MSESVEYIEQLLETAPLPVYGILLSFVVLCSFFAICLKGLKEGAKLFPIIMVIVYAIIVICITMLFRHDREACDIKLLPFWSYLAISKGAPRLLIENVMNIIAFSPIGFFFAAGATKMKWWHAAIAGCCFSIIIELMQYYFSKGQCEIDDVIHNTLGCIIGFGLCRLLKKCYKRCLNPS